MSDSYSYRAYSDMNESLFGVSIKSCGHVFAEKGRAINRPFGRDDWLLFYVARGAERFSLEGETDADEGAFLLFKPEEPQKHICATETCEFYYIHFTAPESFDLFGFSSSKVYKSQPSYQIRELFEDVINEMQTKKPFYERVCVSSLFSIMSRLKRNCESATTPPKKHLAEISSAIRMINKEYFKNLTLGEYAEAFRMSKFHFLRTFKEITGVSPIEYRAKIRLEHGAELLSDTDLPISEISAQLGFASQGYFCDAFKKCYGKSPSAYRKNVLKNS